jgi:hypothetical protein
MFEQLRLKFEFNLKTVHVGFSVDEVTLKQASASL